ncbi:ATP-binding cassette sub-family A member 1 [Portunus trituberculatus]|uniref:ATP-binding cassette sub-family A member 1 n=1 Tax=Portunus trituberculatus TaxID=210409 RepID=A0A5B7CZ41_PORTR|nr:ATP-binding cassette sub-family A member 1 [Portunus trituberculatus]
MNYTHLLPHLLALPYFSSIVKPGELPVNATSASLALFFPPTSSFTATSQPTIEKVKEDVKELEDYLCENFDVVLDELTSNEELTFLMEELGRMLERLLDEEMWNGTRVPYSSINLGLHAAQNISTALTHILLGVEEVVQFSQPLSSPPPPPVSPSQFLTSLENLGEALRQFDFTKPPDMPDFELLVNTSQWEVNRLLAGLRVIEQEWPFLLLDALVQRGPVEVQAVVRETDFALSLLLQGLPPSDANTTITELYQLLNTSWVDLLAGIHHNIHRELALETLTVENVCGGNSTLEEPEGGDGRFLEAVEKLCLFVSSNPDIFEEVKYLQNTSAPLPSTKTLYSKSHDLASSVQQVVVAARDQGVGEALMALQGVESWAEVCQLNASAMGSDIAALQKDVCQVEGEALVQELRGLLGLDLLLQPDPIMTLEDALKLLMVYISTLNEMDRIGTPLTAPGGLVEYLGLQQWMNVSSDVFNVTLEEMEANSIFSIDRTPFRTITTASPIVISETTGTVDLEAAVQDLGSVKEVVAFMAPRLPTLVSLALWLPESYASWRFFRGDHWLEIVEEMCEKGPEHLLLYPGLPQQEWDALRHTFCNLSLPQLGEDLEPLFNVTEVMEGETVNLSKVKEAVGQLMRRLAFLDPFKLDDPFSNNAYTLTTTRFGPVLKIIQGTLGQLIWLYRGTMERMSKSSQFLTAHSLAMAMGAVEPITSDRDHSLLERLVDPALFLQLVKDYQNVQQRMHDTAVAQVESPDYDSVESYPLYGQVYSDLHSTLLNLTESLAVPLVPGTIDSAVAGNTTTTCNALIDQIIATYEKFLEVVQQYERDEGARTHLSDCLSDAIHSDAGQQLIGLMVAARDLLRSVSSSANLTRTFSSSLRSIGVSRSLRKLATRVAVMAPLQEVLVRDYNEKLNMSGRVLEATRHLKVDVNRIYPGDVEELAVLSETLEDMQKWWKVMESEGANHSSTWGPEEETPLEILHKFTMSRGPDVFAADLLDAVNYTYLLREVGNMRTKAVLSLTWLDSLVSHLSVAAESLTELTQSGSVMDLDKMISGEDPVAFLSESVEFIHLEQWSHLAKSFQGLLEEGVPLLTGSQLGDDLQSVVDGVNSILAVRDMGLLDFNVPITSFIANWTKLEDYLLSDLKMEPSVVEALSTSHFNLLSLLSLEGSSVEEVLCGGHQMERFVVLPANTDVTPAQLTSTLCSTNDTQALATSFLSHLTLTPLMTLLTKFGVNASLSSHGLSLEEVSEAIKNVTEVSEYLPTLLTTLRAFHNLSDILLAPPQAEKLVDNRTVATIGDITSPQFLERAGQALCGRPLKLMPDRLRLKETKVKKSSSSDEELEVCERLHKDLRSLPGGGLLLHYIKPLLTGKIFFTPDNTITRAIIAKANETFEAVDRQQQNLRKMSQEAKGMTSSSTNEFDLKRLEDALQSPWVQGAMKELLQSAPSPVSSLKLSSLPSVPSLMANLKEATPQLLESSELIREFSDVLEVGVSLMSCLQLQRFVPVSNESQLLEEAHEAVERKEFLAGIVFQGVGESGSTETALPADLTYTIRVDYSKSPPTFLLGPKFWRPGPYSDVAFYMRYQQGFVQLQETLEHAILKLYHQQAKAGQGTAGERRKRSVNSPLPLTEEEEDLLLNLPVHTKQQPYPCYTKDE